MTLQCDLVDLKDVISRARSRDPNIRSLVEMMVAQQMLADAYRPSAQKGLADEQMGCRGRHLMALLRPRMGGFTATRTG
jgi:hypothetical protein